ncbi:MAG: hypothetical protein V2B20_27880 [Pseudomonadota bacterium]
MSENGLQREFQRKFIHYAKAKQWSQYEELKAKVREGVLFPAIRENTLDFYCGGQRALRRTRDTYKSNDWFLNGGRRENGAGSKDISFRTFPHKNENNETVTLKDILDRCKTRAKVGNTEGYQLSKIFKYFSFASIHADRNSLILIDVEARFAPLDKRKSNNNFDMVDLVFLLPGKRELLFVEGKRRGDDRIRKCAGKYPEVRGQVQGYREQLEKRKNQILNAYKQASDAMDEIFGFTFIAPKSMLPDVPILVVGDSDDEKELRPRKHSNDKWLEPMLEDVPDNTCKIWQKDDVWLMDARAVFVDFPNGVRKFAQGLNELADKVRR